MPCVNSPCRHTQPKSIEQRAEHAKEFLRLMQPPFDLFLDTYIDGWLDPFLKMYTAWPERFYVFQPWLHCTPDGTSSTEWRLRWWNQPSHLQGHNLDDLREWLYEHVERPVPAAPPPLERTTSETLREETRTAKLREVFKAHDPEGKNFISSDALQSLLESVGYMPTTLEAILKEVDLDRTKTISLTEFEALFASIHPRIQEELRELAQLQRVGGPLQPRAAPAGA